MNRDMLFQHLEQHYLSKREMIGRIPLGEQPDDVWQEILNRRRLKSTILPIHSPRGTPYWYVTTQKMAYASERIIEELMNNETDFDPYRNLPATTSLEESFFTSYVEGSQLTMQDAMAFIQGDMEPQSAEEQLILNNRNALNFISANLYRPVSEEFINTVATLLNENMEIGGEGYRSTDYADIPSMMGLSYEVPRAYLIPDSVREITYLIADPAIHPLIKAAVVHAWALTVRPYPDGNERLGRLLSQVILLRSGYHFFSEVSLSSLIARKSYAYFNAMANILLPENSGDLTYFVEYFLCLLADAINERRLRLEADNSDVIQAEQEMSNLPLETPDSPPRKKKGRPSKSVSSVASSQDEPENIEAETEVLGENIAAEGGEYSYVICQLSEQLKSAGEHVINCARLLLDRFHSGLMTFTSEDIAAGLGINPTAASNRITYLRQKNIIKTVDKKDRTAIYGFVTDQEICPGGINKQSLHKRLEEVSFRPSLTGQVSSLLLKYMDSGKAIFLSSEVANDAGITASQAQKVLQTFRDYSLIRSIELKAGSNKFYTFNIELDYSPETLEAIEKLTQSINSIKDRRIGESLKANLSKGLISKADYEEKRWDGDMRLAEQIGLVERVDDACYRILPEIKSSPDALFPYQKKAVTAMYENFGEEAFSHDMFMATLEYSGSHASAILHELTLIRVLDCWQEDGNKYRLNVNPETNPGYFLAVA